MSSWMKLKRLVHTKAWKAFTNKIPLKLNRSKAIIKKPYKTRTQKNFSKKIRWPISLSIQPKKFKNKGNKNPSLSLIQHKISHKRQLNNPVFVDQPFIEQSAFVVEEEEGVEKQKLCSASNLKKSDDDDDDGNMNDVSADDMWESMVLASPQMNGINERAEEFIASFRADMRRQEMVARRL